MNLNFYNSVFCIHTNIFLSILFTSKVPGKLSCRIFLLLAIMRCTEIRA